MANNTSGSPAEPTPEGRGDTAPTAEERPATGDAAAGGSAARSPWAPPYAQDPAEPAAGSGSTAGERRTETTDPTGRWAGTGGWAGPGDSSEPYGSPASYAGQYGYAGGSRPNPYYRPGPEGYGGYPGAATQHTGAQQFGAQQFGVRQPGPERGAGRRGIAQLGVLVLIAALLGGGIGGTVGYALADRGGSGGSSGVLSEPLPEIDTAAAPLSPVEAVAQRVLPSVVQLRVEGQRTAGEGSGMVLSADGLILTNNHVIEVAANGGTVVAVFQDGRNATATIVGRDPNSDLAVIRAQNISGLTPIELGNSESVRVGQQVVAFGSPLGLGGTVTTGIVSALDRAVSVGGDSGISEATVLNALQTDAAINPGNSGGPLVDMQGRVVGVNSAIATTGAQGGSIGVGFSIPINQAKRTAEELERTGKATRAVLGVSLTVGGPRNGTGAVIREITPGGPAEQVGLRPGEIVTRVDDRIITDGNELIAAIRERAPGEQITLTVGDRQVTVTLAGQTG
ncbi:S1C family serine protease [Pseudonocardia bannensis]|uniref:PDZ domain-containing protein n=1 Tax=Pseudonocardia bannensis TaxID=630973 RepID=A0A848DD51_9PSEU|nr:trypsin-like peptidase domain-containing protein [Pseudonocardia bannensis]NMH90524.1 PDZ domain-containing protein [Pseudonocardia bannensis]